MTMTGIYRIELSKNASEEAFVKHMKDDVFTLADALQLTRTTTGMDHELLKSESHARQYHWRARVYLMTNAKYNFDQEERINEHIRGFGKLVGLEVYMHAA
jgi:hypothetical protein